MTTARMLAGIVLGLVLPLPGQADGGVTDPFAYCASVGNADQPGPPYAGPALPDAVSAATVSLGLVSAQAPEEFRAHTTWRCMGGKVWLCSFGANIPCNDRARTSRAPTEGITAFCAENPGNGSIPAVATGRDTIYAWRCDGKMPVVERTVMKPDARGFLSEFWHEVPAPSP